MTKLIAAAGVMLVLVSGCMTVSDQDFAAIRTASDRFLLRVPDDGYMLSADQLLKKIESGSDDFMIVDVRETEDKYRAGHIPGAIYINFKYIAKSFSLEKLPKDKDIILYCNTGHEENKALAVLRLLGYRAYGLKFGYVAWKKAMPTQAMQGAIDNAARKNYPVE